MPLPVSAASVNWGTSSRPPPVSSEAQVHAALGVLEHPVASEPFDQPIGLRLRIRRLDGDEDQQPRADPADDDAIDLDTRMRNALQQANHRSVIRKNIPPEP